jgi:hypothetical protein
MYFARGETTARKNAQPKQKRLRIQLLAGDYLSKVRNIFCRPERPECDVKKGIKNPGWTSTAGTNEAVILR